MGLFAIIPNLLDSREKFSKMTFNPTYHVLLAGCLTLALAGCGGGGSQPPAQSSSITPNSILLSDVLFSIGGVNDRISEVICTADFSRCQATYDGQTFSFSVDGDSSDQTGTGESYQTLGEWNHLRSGVVYVLDQGLQGRMAATGGVVHRGSTPSGSATWTGDMVGLDSNNRVVRGGASIELTDLGNPQVDVRLTPQSRPAMEWQGLAVRNGGFSDRQTASNYIKGEFYGPNAEETGGVFERSGIIGAFGATQ